VRVQPARVVLPLSGASHEPLLFLQLPTKGKSGPCPGLYPFGVGAYKYDAVRTRGVNEEKEEKAN
jgi:hypothetical protein